MKRLNVLLGERPVGQLLAQQGAHYFSFDESFIQAPLPLSPYKLAAIPGVSEHREGHFLTLPGLIYDSLPDRFGMSVLRKKFQDLGILHPTPLQMLSYLGSRTMGALTYAPAKDEADAQEMIDLVNAAQSAKSLQQMEHLDHLDPAIVQAGGTAGGATPKLLAAISPDRSRILTGPSNIPSGMEAWIIKLNTTQAKTSSICQIEQTYFELAKKAGIHVPDTMLLPDKNGVPHFAIRRFDRERSNPNHRLHIHSYAAMAGIDFSSPSTDYEDLLRLTKNLTRNFEDVCEQFRRMLFNLLASNRDDHAKNFSFSMDSEGKWTNTPAYDLLYTNNDLGGNWMLIRGKRNNIRYQDLKQLADLMGISQNQLNTMLEQIQDALSQWPTLAKANGIGTGLRNVVQTVIKDLHSSLGSIT
ncbi:type II toxin-antitoxin system HipA family toxin [Coraliomargarita sp. SDUM461004]|uniref:Type II toxin-antitoxin system HipA family toxin n=1 Tax=Thalassobacterium sedimentorum TaxID=3041258 RepID=A0ABU1AKT5_9BACT|nr:type II toxin-antitoxin system HipA family toxin [Coraliomargarita sp. SDUM461004]MDQ8195421.1 type II toxin-antitoxin system HipA family toxin [Coraliomargarita sp. SDUM461004]